VERDLKATTDRVEHDPEAAFSGYAEVQLAVAIKWDPQQRKMILLEQLYNCDIGQQLQFFACNCFVSIAWVWVKFLQIFGLIKYGS